MKNILNFIMVLAVSLLFAQQQTVTYSFNPASFEENESITITVQGSSVNETTWGVTNNALYIWAWSSDLNIANQMDCPTNGSWTSSSETNRFTYNTGNDTYTITLVPTAFFSRTGIGQIGFLIKAKDGTGDKKSQDILQSVGSFQVNLTQPLEDSSTILSSGGTLAVAANNSGGAANYVLKANGTTLDTQNGITTYNYSHTNITQNQTYALEVTSGSDVITKNFTAIVNPNTQTTVMPSGLENGINYNTADATKATLVLDAPGKDFVYVAGSFNNYTPTAAYAMKKDPANGKFWLELTGLTSNQTETYQYWVVDQTPIANSPSLVKVADPFSTLVLSPFDDPYIPAASYPNLPAYPAGQEREVTVLQTGQTDYNWQITNFVKPEKEKLVVYELLVRDFTDERTYQSLIDRMDYFTDLNINAIELLPVMEFEGNESWGYNPSFHLALDKYYGTEEKFKEFVDVCHQNGIAVILDVALNHVYGRSPLVRMWMNDPDGDGWGAPATDNPYLNTTATHSYSVGEDFNHQQTRTQYYVERTIKHWINEFKIDGFRWDLTKGFTQNCSGGNDGCTNSYQQDRVDILKQYADLQWVEDTDSYVIFEHLGTDNEEQQWANYREAEGKGIMTWGKMTEEYNQNTMGFASSSNFDRVMSSSRGFTKNRLVPFAESHDEERLMYKNLNFGNDTNSTHNVRDLNTALGRMQAQGAMFFTVPGPKMIWQFGELGYDFSINRCTDGTINTNCRTSNKPVRWDYYNVAERKAIYDTWAEIIDLKTTLPVFSSNTYNVVSGDLKPRVYVWDDNLASTEVKNVVAFANFSVNSLSVTPFFPYTGTWYNLLDGTTLNVTSTSQTYSLNAGEFRIYGNQPATLSTEEVAVKENKVYVEMAQNPVKNQTAIIDYFAPNATQLSLQIFSAEGKLIHSQKLTEEKGRINVPSAYTTGVYQVVLQSDKGNDTTQMLVK